MKATSSSDGRKSRGITQVRWTVSKAAAEFDIDQKTLTKRLRASSIEPGEDGRYSTMQICAAKFTDKEIADARDKNAAADLKETKLKQLRRELAPIRDMVRIFTIILVSIRQKVWNDPDLTEEKKREMLADFQEDVSYEYILAHLDESPEVD